MNLKIKGLRVKLKKTKQKKKQHKTWFQWIVFVILKDEFEEKKDNKKKLILLKG